MNTVLLVAMFVHFHNPCRNGCETDLGELTDLSAVMFWTGEPPRIAKILNVAGRECLQENVLVEGLVLGDSLWVVPVDYEGNAACPPYQKILVEERPPVGDAPDPTWPPELRWYDLQGRLLPGRPTTPGVYFCRPCVGPKKIAVVR